MQYHSSNAMFISEIPVRYASPNDHGEKLVKWIDNLNSHTTARDIIKQILPGCDSKNYSLYLHTDRKRQLIKYTSRIYKIVGKINQENSSQRLLFEICLKKRVRFADEIIAQTIVERQTLSNEYKTNNRVETKSVPLEKRLDKLKINFQIYVNRKQENFIKSSSNIKRSSLSKIHENIMYSSNEMHINSNLCNKNLTLSSKSIIETLV